MGIITPDMDSHEVDWSRCPSPSPLTTSAPCDRPDTAYEDLSRLVRAYLSCEGRYVVERQRSIATGRLGPALESSIEELSRVSVALRLAVGAPPDVALDDVAAPSARVDVVVREGGRGGATSARRAWRALAALVLAAWSGVARGFTSRLARSGRSDPIDPSVARAAAADRAEAE